ncbi:NBS-LRR type resistance protein [Cucumis melo var. makuwa]|uniref:NBS-LRR type resistance protein n=1 Tax=Cucumis melo var. makuwa TaxID=1194695 RepID=A0A5D3CBP1_CUCMM|nr:NBS-LRR type resistance protein [Cucumis melo var. makuwa]
MLNDLQALIEHEEEIEKFRLEDEMAMNVGLMHLKVLNGWSNKSFDMLLELLRAAFPMCNSTIPSSFYEAKRKLCDLGLGYETIHACKYDCVLYWKEFADLQHCPTCGEARYFLCDHYISRDEDWLDVMRIGTSSTTIISAMHSRSNHGQTRLLDRSSLTIIVAGPSRFYNDSMSSLKEEASRSVVWNCSGKHTFELGYSCRRPPRMRM